MAYDLTPEQLYHPFGGMNPDANGIMARPNEAVDILNVEVTSSTVRPRTGTRYLNAIIPTLTIDVLDSDSSLADGEYAYQGDVDPDPPNYPVVPFTWTYVLGDYSILPTAQVGGTNRWQILDNGTELYYNETVQETIPRTNWRRTSDGTVSDITISQSILNALPEAVIKYHKFIDPLRGIKVFAFCAHGIHRYDSGEGWVSCYVAGVEVPFEQWDVTDYIDKSVGATIVAAGSKYVRPTEAYTEGSDRVLLYYDPITDQMFHDLQLESDELAEEIFVVTTNPMLGTVSNTPVIASTTYMALEDVGVVCITSQRTFTQITENDSQYLLGVANDDEFVEGPNSWINLVTGDFSVEFSPAPTGSPDLLVLYSHKVPVDYYPLNIANFHNALVISNTYEDTGDTQQYFPWRTRWTQPNDMFTVLQRDYQELALDDISPILAMRSLETTASSNIFGPLYFYKHNSIVRGTYNQSYGLDPSFPVPLFEFEIAFSEGIEAVNTLISNNGVHMFLGRNDVYMFDGYRRISMTEDKDNGNTKIQRVLFDVLDLDLLNKAFGIYDEFNRKYYLFFPEYGEGPYPKQAAIFDIDRLTWDRATFPPTSAGINVDLAPRGIIDRLVGQIGPDDTDPSIGLQGSIQSLTGNSSKLVLLAMPDLTYFIAGNGSDDREGVFNDPVISYFITRDFFGQTLEENDRMQKVMVEGLGDTMEIAWNGDYSRNPEDFHNKQTLSFGSKYRREDYHPDAVTTAIRFIVYLNGVTEFRWLQAFSIKQEFTSE